MPLKEIHRILQDPDLDRNQILGMQKAMLMKKRDRLNRLIGSIDRMLEGEQDMDFEVFGQEELEVLYQAMTAAMTEEQKKSVCEKYGKYGSVSAELSEGCRKRTGTEKFSEGSGMVRR